ncbi:unnamed protein product [Victoria cruziana]
MAYGVAILSVLLLQSASGHGVGGDVVVTGSVSCPHCTSGDQLQGLGVVVGCGRDGQVGGALTNDSGWFKVNMRRPGLLQSAAPCYAMLVSGPRRRCRFKDGHSMARVVDGRLTSPLTFSPASCVGEPSQGLGPASIRGAELGDSKTIDLPLPREWGLPPTSYYTFPVIPIGIP